ELTGEPLEQAAHVGAAVDGRVVPVQAHGHPDGGGPLQVEELGRVVPGAAPVRDLVAQHRAGGDPSLVARGVPELFRSARFVGPGDVGAVPGRPHVGEVRTQGVVHLNGAPLRKGKVGARRTLSHRHVGWCGDHVSGLQAPAPGVYQRHRPETTALYEVVKDNLETLYGAIGDGAIAVRISQTRPQGAGELPRLRAPLPGLCAPEMPGLRGEAAGGVQLQGPGLLPVVYGPAERSEEHTSGLQA